VISPWRFETDFFNSEFSFSKLSIVPFCSENEKQKSIALKSELENVQKKKDKEISHLKSESDEKIKKLEDKIALLEEENTKSKRQVLEAEKKSDKIEKLDFASLDTIDSGKSKSELSFVNPYSSSSDGAKIDPLMDLKSFLNTVDPSKPLNPELKNLLDSIMKKIENDDTIIKSLESIKKKVKDKKLGKLLDDSIKLIKNKRS